MKELNFISSLQKELDNVRKALGKVSYMKHQLQDQDQLDKAFGYTGSTTEKGW